MCPRAPPCRRHHRHRHQRQALQQPQGHHHLSTMAFSRASRRHRHQRQARCPVHRKARGQATMGARRRPRPLGPEAGASRPLESLRRHNPPWEAEAPTPTTGPARSRPALPPLHPAARNACSPARRPRPRRRSPLGSPPLATPTTVREAEDRGPGTGTLDSTTSTAVEGEGVAERARRTRRRGA